MTTSETRQAKKGLPFKDITVEPGDTFWPRMERLMVKYDIDTANVEYASLRETSDQEWASRLYVQYGIGGRFSGIEARVDAGPFFGDLATPPAPPVAVGPNRCRENPGCTQHHGHGGDCTWPPAPAAPEPK